MRYVVATINFFDNEIKQSIQVADDKLSAFKLHQIENAGSQVEDEKLWQINPDYPQTYEDLMDEIGDWDMDASVIEID